LVAALNKRVSFTILIFIITLVGFSQEKGYLEFAGKTIKDQKVLPGAHITVFKGSTKVADVVTGKNGKFMFDLEFGSDYKVTFTSKGCVDKYAMIYASKCPADKEIFPIYDVDVNFFEYGQPLLNYDNFKNPFVKVIYDGKKTFMDDEKYVMQFLKNLYIDAEELKRREDLKLEKEKKEKDLEIAAKLKMQEDDKLRKEQIALAEQKAYEEAELLMKQMEDQTRLEKESKNKNNIAAKETGVNQALVKEEINLTIKSEQKKIKEKQNKAIKTNYENELLKTVAQNERQMKQTSFVKGKSKAESNEIIEILRREAITKAKADEIRFDKKIKTKQAILNSRVLNHEMIGLVKTVAGNEVSLKYSSVKKFPKPQDYKQKKMVGIGTDIENSSVKSTYTINVSEGETKTIYKKEKFTWGLVYYYKNDKEITEAQYYNELKIYNVPL
jgi:hypothetical protein